MTNAATPETLAGFETELSYLADRWKRAYLSARRTRLEFRALCSVTSEMGRDILAADPERARIYLNAASRMADLCRETDIAAARDAHARTLDGEPSPKEEAEARDQWRRRIEAELLWASGSARPAMEETSPPAAPAAPQEPPRWGW
jgi:hypothetical protein